MLDSIGRNNRKLEDKVCENCAKVFRPVDSKKRTCSRECGYKIRKLVPHNKGTSNGWIDSKGYKQIKVDGKNVKEHRYIVESYYKIKLSSNQDVHHINGIKTDNRIENLKIISHSLHSSISNNRRRAKGYKLNLSDDERRGRSDFMKEMRKNNFKKATE